MTSPSAVHILLCAAVADGAADLRRLLEEGGFVVSGHLFAAEGAASPAHLALIDAVREPSAALGFCRRLRDGAGDHYLPILVVTADPSPAARLASLEAGADTYLLRPFTSGELLAQVRALLRSRSMHDRLAEKTAEVGRINRSLQAAHQQIEQELELASRLQQSFLPQKLPELPRARFGVHYRVRGRVGGDFYDVFRLDERHLGFYVADAMGHGVPASLLTIFVKKGVQAKEIFGQDYRLVPPGEVLRRLNRDLVELSLSDQPFITMVYALFNHTAGTLRFARAGHPHPLYVPHRGTPEFLEVRGSLLGVFETEFPDAAHTLRPGDKLLFYSDGIDGAAYDGRAPGGESLRASAAVHRERPIAEFVEAVAADLAPPGDHADDLTLLGLEVLA